MPRPPAVSFRPATLADAIPLAALHTAAANHLTDAYGPGPWSSATSEKGMLLALRTSSVYLACQEAQIVGTWRLTTKKPWAIDTSHFCAAQRPLYLLAMAVSPALQRQGIGRQCLVEAEKIARQWPADALRLDAYDAEAGAGDFYARCGWSEIGRASYRATPLIYFERQLK